MKMKRIILIIVVFSFIFYFFSNLTKNASAFYLNYATSMAEEVVTSTINNSIRTETFETLKDNELFYITKNGDNEIEMIDYNTYIVNLFLDEISSTVQEVMTNLVNKDNLFTIPLFSIFNNPLISNFGPEIPVDLEIAGAVFSNVEIKVKEYGLNNCLIEIFVSLEVKTRVLLPIVSKEMIIKNQIPISYKIINGSIPEYYGGLLSKNSSIYSIPNS